MDATVRDKSAYSESELQDAISAYKPGRFSSIRACARAFRVHIRLFRRAFPALAIEMAEEVRRNRFQLSRTPPSYLRPIGKNWLDRFKKRHPEVKGVWTRKIEGARHNAMNVETVKTWFEAVTELCLQHHYTPDHIYNMDQSGFAIGESQSSRALVNIRENSSWKVISGMQEWITAIECISASGKAIPPLIIFKAKHTNTG